MRLRSFLSACVKRLSTPETASMNTRISVISCIKQYKNIAKMKEVLNIGMPKCGTATSQLN